MLATSKQAAEYMDEMPWIKELVGDVPESVVGIGTNGKEFADLAQGKGCHEVLADAADVDEFKEPLDYTTFYTTLGLFEGIGTVRVVWECPAMGRKTTDITVPKMWRKGWVAQLSACKCLQWLVAITNGFVAKPRLKKSGAFWFASARSKA